MVGTRSWECREISDCGFRNAEREDELQIADCGKTTKQMIARIWHGWTKLADAKTYEDLLRDEIFPGIARRNIEGYLGAELFVHEDRDEVEFVTLLRFDSIDVVKEFAGADESKPVIHPKAERLLTRIDERSRHFRIVI
jgi:hypothetical protein